MELRPRFIHPPRQSFFLFGPRGTGKSTWVRQVLRNALIVDLLQPDVMRQLSARPERLLDLVRGNPDRSTVVIDEIQRVPELLNVVHAILESSDRRRFVLTGSSARKLRRGGVDLLAGRAVFRTLHPFMASELAPGEAFDLNLALRRGMLPLIIGADESSDALRAYASLYLDEEVRLEGWARNVGSFARFLEAVSFSHAAVLNVANLARECQVERKTVASYVEVLEDLLLSFRVPVFARRAKRATTVHPKFFLFDAGIFRSIRPRGPLDRPEEIEGAALEGLVAQHLRAWLAYRGGDARLYYWRTRSGVEVDFVVYGAGAFYAVEVKNGDRVHEQDLRGLQAFVSDFPQAAPIFLYRGNVRERRGRVWILPVGDFLRELQPARAIIASAD
ncbi:MAG: ATP-binding protein [Chloroflexi bacterium]|nr:ATP-binding protein [Chloroflexota bacterium]